MRALLTRRRSVATTTCCSFCSMSESWSTVQRPGRKSSFERDVLAVGEERVGAVEAVVETPEQAFDGRGRCSKSRPCRLRRPSASRRTSARSPRRADRGSPTDKPRVALAGAGRHLAERLREIVEHLLGGALGQKILDVGLGQGREAHLDAVVREDFDLGAVAVRGFGEARVRLRWSAACRTRRAGRRRGRRRGCRASSTLRRARPPCRTCPRPSRRGWRGAWRPRRASRARWAPRPRRA